MFVSPAYWGVIVSETEKQKAYYKERARSYDDSFCSDINDEHYIAAAALSGFLDHFGVRSVLDVGCGTGRMMLYLKSRHPDLLIMGAEPVKELRDEAIRKGVDPSTIRGSGRTGFGIRGFRVRLCHAVRRIASCSASGAGH